MPKRSHPRRKPAAQTAAPAPDLVPQPHGGALLAGGIPGHPGAGGRPRNEWRELVRQAVKDAKALEVLKAIISGDIHELVGHDREGAPIYAETRNRDRIAAAELLIAYAEGRPPQKVELEGSESGGETVLEVVEAARLIVKFYDEEARIQRVLTSGRVIDGGHGNGAGS